MSYSVYIVLFQNLINKYIYISVSQRAEINVTNHFIDSFNSINCLSGTLSRNSYQKSSCKSDRASWRVRLRCYGFLPQWIESLKSKYLLHSIPRFIYFLVSFITLSPRNHRRLAVLNSDFDSLKTGKVRHMYSVNGSWLQKVTSSAKRYLIAEQTVSS